MKLDGLHLAHPELLHGLWIWLVAAAVWALFDARAAGRLNRLVAPALEARLVVRPAAWRRRLRSGLLALAGLCMVTALVQPQWGEERVATPRVGAEIMIALDVSRSMLADDARPSRLERAKAEIVDLLAYLENDQVGLIAFAGRASILSPLTPDKSFLRLALESAGPHSVSRGGTRLAEPILRAVAGLGEPGPSQRALILITDGEDHDSFALDAAKKAAAAGIKIITIGFGSETGSEIHVVDPIDGSRSLVRDGDGNPVVSRLDGELLREIALATDGAYVPAGTGVLDLASIYDAHIARLTRGQLDARGRIIRGETYPIFVGAALVCLVAAVSIAAGRARPASREARSTNDPRVPGAARSAAILFVALVGAGVVALPNRAANAQTPSAPPAQPPSPAPAAPAAAAQDEPGAQASGPPLAPPPAAAPVETPRERFNRANAALASGDAAAASSLFREARRDATDDLDLRYAASFNLGMAAVAQADRLEATKPQAALALLHEAADWFREAVAMRPDDDDPRHNLEVTLRRALILADAIARKDEQSLEAELDRLIEAQREQLASSAMLLEATAHEGELAAAESLRPAFEAAATAQRERMADVETVADRAADEKAILDARPEAERKPEDLLRGASLEGVLAYLDQGVERMGQTRRQLRQRAAERAYRRGAEALDALKRARDQLRDPVEQIGVLIGEVAGVAGGAAALAQADSQAGGAGSAAGPPRTPMPADANDGARLPAFLTPEAVTAETTAVAARVGELAQRFGAAAEQANAATDPAQPGASSGAGGPGGGASPPPATPSSGAADTAAPSEDARMAIIAAAPLIERSSDAMTRAIGSIEGRAYRPTLDAEGEAIAALSEARELFLDLRQLLDLTHASQANIARAATAAGAEAEAVRAAGRASLPEEQRRDRERADRIGRLLRDERSSQRAALEAPKPDEGGAAAEGAAPDPEQLAALEARFDRADALLGEARGAMDEAVAAFGASPSASPSWSRVGESGARAAERLDAIRLLFLSLIEHLQRLEREQTNVADRTREAIALAASDAASPSRSESTQRRASALATEQKGIESRAGAIADALLAQSDAAADAGGAKDGKEAAGAAGGGASGAGSEPDSATLRRAADHVATAQLEMQKSEGVLSESSGPLNPAEPPQRVALEELRKALALLRPPPPDEPEKQDQKQDPQQDQKQDQSQDEQDQDPQPNDPKNDGSEGSGDEKEQPAQAEAQAEERPAGADEAGGASEDESARDGADDPAQLLQGVRDREAERRATKERRERTRRRTAPVEKDW